MKIPKKYKLDQAVSRYEDARFATEHIHIDTDNKCAVATDGRILAVVPCEPSPTEEIIGVPALVPVDAFKAARRAAGGGQKNPDLVLMVDDRVTVQDGAGKRTFDQGKGEFPNYKNVIPAAGAGKIELVINANLLQKLANALGSSGGVKLEIQHVVDDKGVHKHIERNKGIRVTPITQGTEGENDAYGVIMPITKT